ncbi:hypothetical protein [Bosea sp. BIWAKO-01]|uniref:hypothetical protein n=1 Tax=Bosea sp. BIWAKO-01 TaxID=506668 RepID=UPI000AE2BCEF|nr:hypothetical protein [Bosea sp. BIWAKO-01]
MRFIIPMMTAVLLATSGAYAQSINIGPGGVSVDPRSPRDRAIDREIRRDERMRERARWERSSWRDDCRTVRTIEETPRGEIRRTRRICD